MNAKQFIQLYNNVKISLFWANYLELDNNTIKYIESKEKITFLSNESLEQAINELLLFDINLLWDKKFWGLKVHESICAIASEKASFIRSIREKTHLSLI